jgi:aspartate aminotransferase
MQFLSDRILELNESQTLAMAQRSRELANKGIDVINLSLGEPDFATPDHIKEAAKLAIDQNYSYYTPVAGYLELRQAIAAKLKRDNGLEYAADQIVVSTGAKQSIINILMSVLNPGDEVLLPTPYWVSYESMIQLSQGKSVRIPTDVESDFKISPVQLEAAINKKTKAFLFSSPCNPTGSVYTHEELEALAAVFRSYPHVLVISDEIYEFIQFDQKHISIASLAGMKERSVVVNGLSKGFAMTGWRLGYIAAPKEIADACVKLQGQFTSATSSITQRAAIAAMTGDLQATHRMNEAFKKRRDLVLKGLLEIPGLEPNQPQGAFYFFPKVSSFFGKKSGGFVVNNADDLATYLLEEAHVAVVTGEAFGNADYIRLSYATSEEKLTRALERMKAALLKLQ